MIDIFINGIIPLSTLEYVLYTLAVTHITIVAITLYLHRGVCHSAITIHPISNSQRLSENLAAVGYAW